MADLSVLVVEVIKELGSEAMKAVRKMRGSDEGLENLKRSVASIQGVLRHADELCVEKTQFKEWFKTLKEAIYDAEDLLDEISTDVLRQRLVAGDRRMKVVRRFFSSSIQCAYRLRMARKIEAVRDVLKGIAENRSFLLEFSRETPGVTRRSIREQTHSSAPQLFVGRENDKQAIIELLISSDYEENVSIIAIVGIGGLGKTSLAQYVYDDENVKMHFELRSWACISDNFDVELAVRKIIESASGKKPESTEMDPLKYRLHDTINGKRFLIVLDDLWSDDREKWSRLNDLLAGGARGSKIVITTRLRKVAETTRPIYIHQLQGLSETQSWSLFKQMAFKRGQQPSPTVEAIGKEIVARCSGVPLAVKTIGALLYHRDSESQWLSFRDEQLLKVDKSESGILPTLKLSYNHLPYHLKLCFAYCSLFPKDYLFYVDSLIQLWIAQGYIVPHDSNRCLEDIGNEYFEDLHWGSFFQEVQKDEFGNIVYCKMHDLMHDLAIEVSGEECVISKTDMDDISASSMHISFQCGQGSEWQFSPSLSKGSKVRTLLMLDREGPLMKEEQCNEIFSSLRCLRVMDLNGLQIEAVPSSIGKLRHLRYLDLSGNYGIKMLPDSITKLLNLQVLNLACLSIKRLPKDIKNLVNLTHLGIEVCSELTHMPRGIGELIRLTKLSTFVIGEDGSVSAGLGELGGLNLLRGMLAIEKLRNVRDATCECEAAQLKRKRHLQELSLEWNYSDDDSTRTTADVEKNNEMAFEALEPHPYLKSLRIRSYMGVKLPSWLSSLKILFRIHFHDCPNIKRLPPFDQLLSLKVLWIDGLSNLEYIEGSGVNSSSSFFPSLETLSLSRCPNLKGWNIEKAESLQFPSLSSLYVMCCPNLTSMPVAPSLKTMACGRRILTSEESSSFPCSLFPFLSHLEKLNIIRENGDLNIIPESTRTTLPPDDSDHKLLWQSLKSLRHLSLSNLPNLGSLPKGVQHLTTLGTLEIRWSEELVSLSNEPQYLFSSLHTLEINDCDQLISLPDWMLNLPGLQSLNISRSPQLAKRFKDNMPPDWHKISHIPNIIIDDKWIQRNSSYLL